MDCQSQRINESQVTENTTAYGSNVYGAFTGTGTPAMRVNVTGFPFKGNGNGTSSLGFGVMGAAGGDTGGNATFTLDTGVNIAGSFIVDNMDLDHSRIQAAAKSTMSLLNAADPITTWAT
jgi:hypothetical protein